MRFWDSSALVPLVLVDQSRDELLALLEQDPAILAWWGTRVECTAAVARREREGALTVADAGAALERLRALAAQWQEILPADVVRRGAERLLRVHPLRSADSLQLAAAIVAAEHEPATLEFVSLDERLNEAAGREEFPVRSL
ncbi:MAG: type II toxin-antitoxin system VapC family toxin [Gemmatimonadales bacterium]